ncbi:MAG: hypothetical protein J5635_05590, partial [Paludibacteraceae bacterium]|nr:hypothetical protein [Paludibacteraceae bacterium]
LTGALIDTVSTQGTQGETYPIYNLAFTADSVLLGASYGMNEFDDSRVPAGRTRGVFRVYYWNMDTLTNAPREFMNSTLSGNFYSAWTGNSFAVAGTLDAATVYTDALTTGMTNIRVMQFVVDSFKVSSSCRNQEASVLTLPNYGDYTQIVSPRADERTVIMGTLKGAEYGWNADAQAPLYGFMLPATKGGQAFRYGGQAVIAAPVLNNGAVSSINLYNVSEDRSVLGVTTTNIAENIQAEYYSVKPLASGKNIVLYLATENHIYRYTTSGIDQPTFRNIYAYDLKAVRNGEESYDLSFSLNTEATEATIHIYSEEGLEVKTIPVAAPALTGNSVNLPLPIEGLQEDAIFNWAVEAAAPEVGNWSVAEQKSAASMGMTRVFNAVNVFPETDHFGTIYLVNYVSKTSPANGLVVMNPDLTLQNTTPYNSTNNGAGLYRTPYRAGITSDGTVFISDWDDTHSGVYVVDPQNPAGPHTSFFAGAQSGSAGVWKNASGVEEGSSSPSAFVYGTGADAKLLVYNEDPGSTLPANGLCVYNIGQPDGSYLKLWDGAPSATITFEGQANTNGNVWGCTKGVWVSQHRSAGNNNNSATSLRFYSWDGHCTFASHLAPTFADGTLVIDGSLGSCFALSPDEHFLALRGTDKNIMLFDVAWNDSTPTLIYKGDMKNTWTGEFDLLQMNWDYAGNLIASGNAGVAVIAVPKPGNRCITPASHANRIVNGDLPFDHCLYVPEDATLSTNFFTSAWAEDTTSTAVLDSRGDILVSIAQAKNARWQAQVKLHTGLDLDESKLYSLTFKLQANAVVPGITVRMFEKAIMLTDSTINLAANEEIIFFADSIEAVAGDGTLVFDFGFAPAEALIAITDIAICEVGDKPRVIYDHLYEIGDNQGWKPAEGLPMTKRQDNVFEGTFVFTAATSYFAFTTVLSEDWAVVNANRFGGATNNQLVTDGTVADLAIGELCLTIAPGTYTITVDLDALTATVHKEDTGLDNLNSDSQATKFFRDGHIFIRKDGHIYNTAGILVE